MAGDGADIEADTFKRLTVDNWSEADPTLKVFGEIDLRSGAHRPMGGGQWAARILSYQLPADVPAAIREQWQIGQGILLYGWYFYPLYAVGDAHLHRVWEAAVSTAYKRAGGPPTKSGRSPALSRQISWLISRGVLPKDQQTRFEAMTNLRNFGSHLGEGLTILTPLDALATLALLRDEITAIFPAEAADSDAQTV